MAELTPSVKVLTPLLGLARIPNKGFFSMRSVAVTYELTIIAHTLVGGELDELLETQETKMMHNKHTTKE